MKKKISLNKLDMVFLSVPNLIPWLIYRAWIVTDHLCWITLYFDREGTKGRWQEEWGGGYYSREAIILNISMKGGDYSRQAIDRGTAIISGNTVPFTDKRYPFHIPSRLET